MKIDRRKFNVYDVIHTVHNGSLISFPKEKEGSHCFQIYKYDCKKDKVIKNIGVFSERSDIQKFFDYNNLVFSYKKHHKYLYMIFNRKYIKKSLTLK